MCISSSTVRRKHTKVSRVIKHSRPYLLTANRASVRSGTHGYASCYGAHIDIYTVEVTIQVEKGTRTSEVLKPQRLCATVKPLIATMTAQRAGHVGLNRWMEREQHREDV